MTILTGIAIKPKKRDPMQILDVARISKSHGVENDFRGKPGKRQVTLLCHKAWSRACAELNEPLDEPLHWTTRRANLLVDDIDLQQSTGKIIKIGDVSLLITGETDPCSRMNETTPGLFNALLPDWRGGVCCQVLTEGKISINDKVILVG